MKFFGCIIVSIISITFWSCQKEELEIIDSGNQQTLTSVSPLTGLVSRVAQNSTTKDNVLDNTSCFKVQLPVTVIVNGQNIIIDDESDYTTVQGAIDAFSNDDDLVNFIYPITIQYQNFQTKIISNKDQLDDALDDCGEEEGFHEIDCVNFVYPITINVYNSGSQTPEVLTFTSNSSLFNFLDNLESDDLIAIKYPISVVDSNSQTVIINNNSQLENFIEDSIDDCNDNSGSGGGSSDPTFTSILTSGTWQITYYYDDIDDTSNFSGYTFTFNSNGTVIVQKGSIVINGNWASFLDSNGIRKLDLNFDGEVLDDIEEDWKLIEFNTTNIRLKDVSGGDGSTSYLYFTKN